MNTMAWIILLVVAFLIVFDIAFLFGCWWATREKDIDYIALKAFGLKPDTPIYETVVCKRCGSRFGTEFSESDVLCQHCVNELKENPDDEYFKKEMFE